MNKLVLYAFISFHLRLIASPIWFEPNQGQAHPSVQFLARTSAGYVYLGRNQLAVQVNGKPVRMNLENANVKPEAGLEEPLDAISSYFSGQTEKDWHTGIPHYARVRYTDVYRGIDLVYYANGSDLEYDFRLRPNADPSRIKLAYNQPVTTDANGDLLVGGMRQKRPKVYQNDQEVACDYLVRDQHHVQLALATYDKSQPLTVDPVLVFSTYLGGPGYTGGTGGITLDSQGFIYVADSTQSPSGPTLNPFQQTTISSLAPFVLKMTPDGAHVVYFAVLGRNGWDQSTGLALDSSGSAVITGRTSSTNFPLMRAIQSQNTSIWYTGFFAKLSPDARSLIYSTYFGGSNVDFAEAVALDQQGNAFFTGHTLSNNFPTFDAYQPKTKGSEDCYLAKVSPAGSLIFSTLFGGGGEDRCVGVATDRIGNAYVAGESASQDLPLKNAIQTAVFPYVGYGTPMLLKFSPDGMPLVATFFGGPVYAVANRVALDAAGQIFVAGNAWQANFQTKNGFQDTPGGPQNAFLVKFSSDLSTVIFSTLLGGSGSVIALGLAVDSQGSAYLTGGAASADFPLKNSLQPFRSAGTTGMDAYVTKFTPSGDALVYSTFLGGAAGDNGNAIAVDRAGNAFVLGTTYSEDFPTVNAFQSAKGGNEDAFLAEISDDSPLAPSPLSPTPGLIQFRFVQDGPLPPVQNVSVAGGPFTASSSASWVSAAGSASSVAVSVNPAGLSPGAYQANVSLTPEAGTAASIAVVLTVLSPAPTLASIDPTLVPIGSSSTVVTIHGSGFQPDSAVQVAGVAVPSVVFVDSRTLRVSLAQGYFSSPSSYTLAVQNPTSDLSNVLLLSVGTPAPAFTAASVLNAASFASGPVAPGEILSIFGTNLDRNVTVAGFPAMLVYFSPKQVNVTVPYQIAGQATAQMVIGPVPSSAAVTLHVAPAGVFAAVPVGNNIVTLYATGCGSLSDTNLIQLPVSVTANGKPTQVLYAGIAPGEPEGVDQINIQLPDGTSGPISIILKAGDTQSQPFTLNAP